MDATLFTLAVLGLGAAFYAHLRLGDFVRGKWQTVALRFFLAVLGAGVGILAARIIAQSTPVLAFLAGFGLVHLPPALVLMLKGVRGEGRS